MPFYLIRGGNKHDEFFRDVEFFENVIELKHFISKIDKSMKPKFSQIHTYIKFIICHGEFDCDAESIIQQTNVKYGDLLEKVFPNQLPVTPDDKNIFIKKINDRFRKMDEDALDAWDNAEKKQPDFYPKNSDWQQSYDDETHQWDRETGGSWRSGSDFG